MICYGRERIAKLRLWEAVVKPFLVARMDMVSFNFRVFNPVEGLPEGATLKGNRFSHEDAKYDHSFGGRFGRRRFPDATCL
jgi:hypothetical protein